MAVIIASVIPAFTQCQHNYKGVAGLEPLGSVSRSLAFCGSWFSCTLRHRHGHLFLFAAPAKPCACLVLRLVAARSSLLLLLATLHLWRLVTPTIQCGCINRLEIFIVRHGKDLP